MNTIHLNEILHPKSSYRRDIVRCYETRREFVSSPLGWTLFETTFFKGGREALNRDGIWIYHHDYPPQVDYNEIINIGNNLDKWKLN